MKTSKSMFMAFVAMLLIGVANAQQPEVPTINPSYMDSTYYLPDGWMDWWGDSSSGVQYEPLVFTSSVPEYGGGYAMATDVIGDTITIYGVAGCAIFIDCSDDFNNQFRLKYFCYPDTDCVAVAFTADLDTSDYMHNLCNINILRKGKRRINNPSYMLPELPIKRQGGMSDTVISFPLYEIYFNSPISLGDTTLWLTIYSYIPDYGTVFSSRVTLINGENLGPEVADRIFVVVDLGDTALYTLPAVNTHQGSLTIMFPILTPDPNRAPDTAATDTTQVDTTQNAIATARLLERYVNVYPTVTDGGAVTVMSSFHLETVEVYDAAGRMVSRQPAKGIAAALDTSQLPSGTYMLRIKTVSGTTTRKLVIR